MSSWTQGYVADIPYSTGFYRELSPAHMAFAALAVGRSPGHAIAPRRYLELGFGQGFGLVLLAAANPQMEVMGIDFNPEHVSHARRLAERAGLTNVTLEESSFQDAAARSVEIGPDLDVLVLHGIMSWVSPEAQDAIVEIARNRLKPGGILYTSYNCMPGWAAMAPAQRLIREHARRHPARSDKQTEAALSFMEKLKAGGARYFPVNPTIAPRLEKLAKQSRNYLAHEYLNQHWTPFYFPDVASMLDRAKLTFIASATITENIDILAVPEGMQELMTQAEDISWRELLRDFASNKQFRRDLFARGAMDLTGPEHRQALEKVKFTLSVPRNGVSFEFQSPLGETQGHKEIYTPIADLLASGIVGFSDAMALPEMRERRPGLVLQAISLLIHSSQAVPIFEGASIDPANAQRFNRLVVEDMKVGRTFSYVASPVAGTGIPVGVIDLLTLAAVMDGKSGSTEEAATYAYSILRGLGQRPVKNGEMIRDEKEATDFLASSIGPVLTDRLPIWQRLGVL